MLQQIVLRDAAAACWMLFVDPLDVLVATDESKVFSVIDEAERRVRGDGIYAAGFVTYEAAVGFDPAFTTHARGRLPLICLGLFRKPQFVQCLQSPTGTSPVSGDWQMSGSREGYVEKIAAIKKQIAKGNTYQVNYTVRQYNDNAIDAWELFLNVAADAPYAAYVDCTDHAIVSASPELFFELNDERLTCKPMKGTAARGMTLQDDREIREKFGQSVKDRAENVMIADMMRNDVGRIAQPGSVQAPALFNIEKYRTVWQMTSTVTAATRVSVAEIFRALFPCASVTGAPKVSSMKIIADLEDSPREIYTGAIGFLAPQRQARFNVAIRTAWIDKKARKAIYGTGGGIVWDSDAEDEYQECLNKSKVLSSSTFSGDFELLETLLWTPDGGFFLLDEHLHRLSDSAEYFDFVIEREPIESRLNVLARRRPRVPCRIRLLLHRDGKFTAEKAPAPDGDACVRLKLAAHPVNADDPFLYHKTTHREIYERALSAVDDCDDVLLWNRDSEITESSIANVVVRTKDGLVTPPVDCGLLAGTFRQKLLREGKIKERKIVLADLETVDEIFLINSVRGWIRGRLDSRSDGNRPSTSNAVPKVAIPCQDRSK